MSLLWRFAVKAGFADFVGQARDGLACRRACGRILNPAFGGIREMVLPDTLRDETMGARE